MNIKKVAEILGVSTYTVSCAISGRGSLSDDTRERVLRKVAELGYTPSANGRWLVTGHSGLVALDDRRADLFDDQFAMQLARGAQYALQNSGFSLLLNVATGGTAETEQLRQWTQSRTVEGVLIVRSEAFNEEMIREISEARTPCVILGTWTHEWPYVASVGVSHDGARQAARLLVEQGHRRIAFISQSDPHMKAAFEKELECLGAPLATEYVTHLPSNIPDPKDGAAAFRALMEQDPHITAIMFGHAEYAVAALREARLLGMRVPRDISFIGHYDLSICDVTDPPLTTVRFDGASIGRLAGNMLLRLMREPKISPRRVEVPTELVVRESVGPARIPSSRSVASQQCVVREMEPVVKDRS